MNMEEIEVNKKVYVLKSSIKAPPVKLSAKAASKSHPYEVGKPWFVMTATHYYIGDLVLVTEGELVLENAAWVPETGRFNEFMSGKIQPNELEPCGDVPVIISRGAIIAAMPKAGIQIVTR